MKSMHTWSLSSVSVDAKPRFSKRRVIHSKSLVAMFPPAAKQYPESSRRRVTVKSASTPPRTFRPERRDRARKNFPKHGWSKIMATHSVATAPKFSGRSKVSSDSLDQIQVAPMLFVRAGMSAGSLSVSRKERRRQTPRGLQRRLRKSPTVWVRLKRHLASTSLLLVLY